MASPPPADTMPTGMRYLSITIGWTYTAIWTVTFYPFVFSNIRRRSTQGISVDFCLLNLLGMAAYAVYNVLLVFSPVVRRQYAERNPDSPEPIVQPNDVAYAVHGLAISAVIYSQYYPRLWNFDRTRPAKLSLWCCLTFWYCVAAAFLGVAVAIAFPQSQSWMWLDVVYLVGNIKTLLTLVKYAPQAWLNYQRKSTQGLPLLPFTLDIGGAFLSLLQLVIDSAYSEQPAALANPTKLVLANVTICFDIVFLFQRFVLYKDAVDEMLDPKCVAEGRQLLEPEV